MSVLELAMDNVVFMSRFSHSSCDFNGKFRKEKEKVKYVNILKIGGGVIQHICPAQTVRYSRGMSQYSSFHP